jgi:hypothetical protein
MNKTKFLALAVSMTAFCFCARAQTATSPATSIRAVQDSTSHTATTAFQVAQPDSLGDLTVIVGHDTMKVKDTIDIPAVGPIVPASHIGPIPVPAWLQYVFIVLATILFTVLPAIQAVLKVIPTPWSVRISGVLGKILDKATFFIKDAKTDGGVHA